MGQGAAEANEPSTARLHWWVSGWVGAAPVHPLQCSRAGQGRWHHTRMVIHGCGAPPCSDFHTPTRTPYRACCSCARRQAREATHTHTHTHTPPPFQHMHTHRPLRPPLLTALNQLHALDVAALALGLSREGMTKGSGATCEWLLAGLSPLGVPTRRAGVLLNHACGLCWLAVANHAALKLRTELPTVIA